MTGNIRNINFLMIGGTTKAGTTSVYKYLSSHPQVCASNIKETRFFLDEDYPLPRKNEFNRELVGYAEHYPDQCLDQTKLHVEATPDYLYSSSAVMVSDLLPAAKIIFILRDPVDRLVSWYKFAKQRGVLDCEVGFNEYVTTQFNTGIEKATPLHLRALEQGRYMTYLARFLEKMPDRVLVLHYDILKNNPTEFMRTVCMFAGLDFGCYKDYAYSVENKSKKVKSQFVERLYNTLRRGVAYRAAQNKHLLRIFRICNAPLKRLMESNREASEDVHMPDRLRRQLTEYYRNEMVFIEKLQKE